MSDAQPIRKKGITLGNPRRMSPDELAAEEARIIEENFPKHRTLHLKPNGGTAQTGERIDIVVTEEVLLATAHHVAQDMVRESGGFLLGNQYVCPNTNRRYIVVDQYMKADYTEGTQVSLTFTTDSWAQLKDRLDGKYRGKTLVGWYHSHPNMGIFLSNYDLDIHKNRFANEWDVALVLDPVKHEGGFFAWVNGNVNPREKLDFYELLDGDSRETVVAWTNYTAEDPKTGVAAALKAVNTQNSDGNPLTAASASQRAQTATATSGLLSNPYAIIGGAAVLAVLLLGTVFAGYWMFFRNISSKTTEVNSEKGQKVLNADRIKLDISNGRVSQDGKLTVELKIKSIGAPDVIEQVRKDGNIEIEIDGQSTTTPKSEVINGVLEVKTETILSPDKLQKFKQNEQQVLDVRVDLRYADGDTAAKQMTAKYSKGKEKSEDRSLGVEVVFNEKSEKTIDSKIKPKVVTTDKPNEPQQTDRDNDKQQQQTQKSDNNPTTKKNQTTTTTTKTTKTTTTATPKKGTAVQDDNNPVVNNPVVKPVVNGAKRVGGAIKP